MIGSQNVAVKHFFVFHSDNTEEQDPRLQGRAPGFRGKGYQVRDKTGIRQGQDRDKSGARQRKDREKIREVEG